MTAYAVPPEWEHGDYPLAADLNKIRDGQLYFYERMPTYAVNSCVKELGSDASLTFTHRHRWLHYKSTGDITDAADASNTESLSNQSTVNVYDLDSIAWLTYGSVYYVDGVNFASEEPTA